jgi:hypothetical protein
MSGPRVRFVGQVEDMDGMPVKVGVDHDAVTIQAWGTPIRFQSAAAEEFAQLYVSACWQAARQAGEMAAEAVPVEVIEPAAQAREDVRGMWNAAFGHDP